MDNFKACTFELERLGWVIQGGVILGWGNPPTQSRSDGPTPLKHSIQLSFEGYYPSPTPVRPKPRGASVTGTRRPFGPPKIASKFYLLFGSFLDRFWVPKLSQKCSKIGPKSSPKPTWRWKLPPESFFHDLCCVFLRIFRRLFMLLSLYAAIVACIVFEPFSSLSLSAGFVFVAPILSIKPKVFMIFQGALSHRRRHDEGKIQRKSGKIDFPVVVFF